MVVAGFVRTPLEGRDDFAAAPPGRGELHGYPSMLVHFEEAPGWVTVKLVQTSHVPTTPSFFDKILPPFVSDEIDVSVYQLT